LTAKKGASETFVWFFDLVNYSIKKLRKKKRVKEKSFFTVMLLYYY